MNQQLSHLDLEEALSSFSVLEFWSAGAINVILNQNTKKKEEKKKEMGMA